MRCTCKKCYDRPDFAGFEQLSTHMERNHRLYACRLCVDHLKVILFIHFINFCYVYLQFLN